MMFGIIVSLLCFLSCGICQDDSNGGYAVTTSGGSSGGGFSSKPLIFTTILFEPYLMQNTDSSAVGNDRFVGFIPDLVKELSQRLHFDYELHLVRDNKWGARDQSTGKWNGMIGEVIRGEVNFAAAPVTVTDIRKSVVDFTTSFQDVSLTALVRAGSNIRSLEELLASNFTYGTIRSGSTANALLHSRNPQMSTLWARIVSQNGMVDSTEEGRQMAKNGEYAFIMETPIAEYLVSQDCGLQTTGNFFEQAGFAFVAEKYYQDLPKFNQAIVQMKQDGEIQSMIDVWWAPQACAASQSIVLSFALITSALCFALFA